MKENSIKKTSNYMPYNRGGVMRKMPGKPVEAINVGFQIIYLTISPHRKDFNQVVDQIWKQRHAKLPAYEQSLFHSCFKNW